MPFSRIRFILAVLAIIILIATYNLAKYNPHILVFFNIALLFWWLALGFIGGALFSLFLLILFFQPHFEYLHTVNIAGVYILSFIVSGLIGYIFNKRINNVEQSSRVDIEKLEGDTNELLSQLDQKDKEIKAMRLRLERFFNLRKAIDRFLLTLDQDKITQTIVGAAYEIVGKSDRVLLYLVDTASQELKLLRTKRTKFVTPVREKKGDIFDRLVLKQRRPLLVKDIYKDFRFSLGKDVKRDFNSIISAPFMSQDKVMGVLRMDSLKKNLYNQEDLRLLDIISDIGTVALQNTFLYKMVEELAITDSLTGLYVHKYFRDRLKKEAGRALRSGSSFSVLILDVDDFKAYNDRYGHVSGDLVLKHISSILNSIAKPGDVVARCGGEEFALILLGRTRQEAFRVAQEIQNEIRSNPLVLRRVPSHLTVSIGLATLPDDAKLEEDVIKCADMCLYRAKREGKDRVCQKG